MVFWWFLCCVVVGFCVDSGGFSMGASVWVVVDFLWGADMWVVVDFVI